ncbi:MAG: porin [Planctomycetota bacterium]|nr:porin [Planctomycetota bacterium]
MSHASTTHFALAAASVLLATSALHGQVSLEAPVGATLQEDSLEALRADFEALRRHNEALERSNQSLAERNEALSSSLAVQNQDWLDADRVAEIRGIVQDVLADTQGRTSLQDGGLSAGYSAGRGFFIGSQDGSFNLNVNGQLQTRWVFNRNPGSSPGVSESDWGFQVRRAKVRFQGNVIDPSWTYQINGSFEGPDAPGLTIGGPVQGPGGGALVTGTIGVRSPSNGGTFEFQEVFIAKQLENGIVLTVGQFKTPWMREELVDSSQQLAVERSVINEFFNQDRAVGVMASYQSDSWSLAGSYNNGQATAVYQDTRYTNLSDSPTDWAFSARFQWKFTGDWSDFDSFTSDNTTETAVMVGVAAMGQQYGLNSVFARVRNVNNASSTADLSLDSTTVWGVTADISAKFSGWSIFAAAVWQYYDPTIQKRDTGAVPLNAFNNTRSFESYNPWGFVVQAGYALTADADGNAKWELFARYEEGNAADDRFDSIIPGQSTVEGGTPSILTVGANYFFNDNVKFTVDWGINFAEEMSLFAQSPSVAGWESSDAPDQWVLRAQMQLIF